MEAATQTIDTLVEEARVAVLADYGVLDSAPEEDFDQLVWLAAELCDAPIALVSLVDRDRLFFKSRFGIEQTEMARADAGFDDYCIAQGDLLVVPDAEADERFSSFPAVRSGLIRFYAGAPLEVNEGVALGTLCVIDMVPRDLDDNGRAALRTLARQVAAQLQLKRTLARQRQLDQLKSDFVGMVAHDLRSPITVIAGFAELLSRDWADLPEHDRNRYLELISGNVHNLSRLVDDVLEVAEVDAGKFQLEIQPFDLASLIERTVMELSAAHAPRRLEVEIPPGLPTALGDEGRNRQVLANLVTNALKFSADEEPVSIAVAVDDSVLAVSVTDRGVGIPAEDMPRLFERFSRLPNSRQAKTKGTGLGLYICRQLVEAQGGRISAQSVPGLGSTFRYTLPHA
jgi:signal transduction histidine kinase